MRLRAIAAVAATVATLGLVTAAGAQATPRQTASCTSFQVGDSMAYGNAGMTAGWIAQVYSTCTGYTYAQWTWNTTYMQLHPGVTVYIGLGSPALDEGQPHFGRELNSSPGNPVVAYWGLPHGEINPDYWRAGAVMGVGGNCVAWTSEHWYANGAELAGPYAGCNDLNQSQIPFTQP